MALTDDLKNAIEKNLSAEVGATLKKVLDRAEADASALALSKMSEENLRNQLHALQKQVKSQEALEELISKNQETEAKALAATAFKQMVDLKMKHSEERVADMKHLVGLVFQNNFYKYQVMDSGSTPVNMGNGCVTSAGHSRTITGTGEGAPPPPPASGP
jgi:hypothetical protein